MKKLLGLKKRLSLPTRLVGGDGFNRPGNGADPAGLALLLVGANNLAFSGDYSIFDVGHHLVADRQLADLDLSPALTGMTFLRVSAGSRRATFDNIISILESQ